MVIPRNCTLGGNLQSIYLNFGCKYDTRERLDGSLAFHLLRIRTTLSSRNSQSTGYVPDYSFGRIHYFCNGLSAKTDKEKPR